MVRERIESTDDFLKARRLTLDKGLPRIEIKGRQQLFGPNILSPPATQSLFSLFAEEFEDTLVRILLAASAVSFGLAAISRDASDLTEPFVIGSILILNALVSCWQKRSADDAIRALSDLSPKQTMCLRMGQWALVNSADIVPGDVISLTVGTRVPGDARVVQMNATSLLVDESALTGESLPVSKCLYEEMPRAARNARFPPFMVYAGTFIAHGNAIAVVRETGRRTEVGKIDALMREASTDAKTPLQRTMDEFGASLAKWIGWICAAVFCVHCLRDFLREGLPGLPGAALRSFKIAISLAVAAIPEGLPAVVTTCLALGARRMAKRSAIVRSLPSVETIGCCNVICSDKTGTLTTNALAVAEIQTLTPDGEMATYSLDRSDPKDIIIKTSLEVDPGTVDHALGEVIRACALCTEAKITVEPYDYGEAPTKVSYTGAQTDLALLRAVDDFEDRTKISTARLHDDLKWELDTKKHTFGFTQQRRAMSVFIQRSDSGVLYVKGAPEVILSACTFARHSGGEEFEMTDELREILLEGLQSMTAHDKALRVLAFAVKDIGERVFDSDLPQDPADFGSIEEDLTFCGFVGMTDPSRPEVPAAISACQAAGVRVIVVTGDARETAEAVCCQIGLLKKPKKASSDPFVKQSITAADFLAFGKVEQANFLKNAVVFSRADPAFKPHLVDLLKESGAVVAMTGDGVNDGPALRAAHIGIGMGSGTDVAKGASSIVLADDNFKTIVEAVREGRAIFANTKQFIRYLISSNIGEVVCVFLAGLLGLPDIFEPVQLLWVNLVTDGLPAIALSFNPPDPDNMRRPPRSPQETILSKWVQLRYLIIGVYIGLATLWGYLAWFLRHGFTFWELIDPSLLEGNADRLAVLRDPREARSVAFTVMVFLEIWNSFNALSENASLRDVPPQKNMWLVAANVLSAVLHIAVLSVPSLQAVFHTVPLQVGTDWVDVLKLSLPVLLLDEGLKMASR